MLKISRRKDRGFIPRALGILLLALTAVFIVNLLLKPRTQDAGAVGPLPILGGMAYNNWLNLTYDIKTDPYHAGWTWFATHEGARLFRSVDHTWKIFHYQDGLPSLQVSSVDFDPDAVWFGTWGGLVRFDRKSETFDTLMGEAPLPADKIFDIYVEGEHVWAGTQGFGLVRFNKGQGKTDYFGIGEGLASADVYCISRHLGVFYLGHGDGSISYGSPETGWKELAYPEAESQHRKVQIWEIVPRGNQLWVATSEAGIWQYDFPRKTWTQHLKDKGFTAKGAYALVQDDSSIYAGTYMGIFKYDPVQDFWLHLPEEEDLTRRQVTALEITEGPPGQSALWYGAAGRGVGLCRTDRVGWQEFSAGLTREGAVALEPMGDLLWVGFGYKGGYLDLWHRDFLHIRNYNLWVGQKLEDVNFITRIGSSVFMGGLTGFGYYDDSAAQPKWKIFNQGGVEGEAFQDITCIAGTDRGILVATGSGIFAFDRERDTLHLAGGLPRAYISAMLYRKPYLILGTLAQGLFLYEDKKGSWKEVLRVGAGKMDLITAALAVDSTERSTEKSMEKMTEIWLGTRRQGLMALSLGTDGAPAASDVRRFAAEELKDAYVTCLAVEGENVWVGTRDRGIRIFHRGRKTWTDLNQKNILQSDKVNTIKIDSRYVWIGDGLGYSRIGRDSLAGILKKVGGE